MKALICDRVGVLVNLNTNTMKNLLFILVCLFTVHTFGQQKMNQQNQSSTEWKAPKELYAQEPTTEIVRQEICPVEGYKITLYRDKSTGTGVSDRRYIEVVGKRKEFYATAAQIAVLPNFSGVPQPNGPPVTFNSGTGYLSVENVGTIDPLKKYCDRNGYRLIPANATIYKVYMGDNNQQWSGVVTITSGSNLDSAFTWLLVKKYNDKRFFVGAERVPEACLSDCYNAGGSGGVDPTPPDGKPTTYVDASGVAHDWFDNDGEEGGIGNPTGGFSTTVLHEKLSLIAGGIANPLGDDIGNNGYVNQMYGAQLGAYIPITTKKPVSFGVYASGDYMTSKKDGFRHQPEGFEVSNMSSLVKPNNENSIKQSLLMFGVGPQINFGLGSKVALSAIVQGGLAAFKQSEFTFVQEFQEGDARIPVEIFNQKETKSTDFFWIPRMRLTYAISSRIGIWAEGNYLMGTIKANQTQLDPGMSGGDDGTFTFGQVNGAEKIERTAEYDLKGVGFGVGIIFSLSK